MHPITTVTKCRLMQLSINIPLYWNYGIPSIGIMGFLPQFLQGRQGYRQGRHCLPWNPPGPWLRAWTWRAVMRLVTPCHWCDGIEGRRCAAWKVVYVLGVGQAIHSVPDLFFLLFFINSLSWCQVLNVDNVIIYANATACCYITLFIARGAAECK